jgi:hypothetical protein
MKKILILTLILSIFSCETENDDLSKTDSDKPNIDNGIVTDTIRIDSNLKSPTISVGYYGFALEYKGDFMPGTNNPGTIDSLQTDIYIYHKLTFDSIRNARTEDYSLFWYIDSIKQTPISIIRTNSKGFYEVELDSGSYTGLIRYDENTFYNNGGTGDGYLGALVINSDTLIQRNFRIDFEMDE